MQIENLYPILTSINTNAHAAANILFTQKNLSDSQDTPLTMTESKAAWLKSKRELLHLCMDLVHAIYDEIYEGYTQAAKENRDKNGSDETYNLLKRMATLMPTLRYMHEPIFECAFEQLESLASQFLHFEGLEDE